MEGINLYQKGGFNHTQTRGLTKCIQWFEPLDAILGVSQGLLSAQIFTWRHSHLMMKYPIEMSTA
jgi:hypothetical protein